jgi:1-acyl-sn-glycerol-3-phosphate acyltransferase
VLLYRSLRALFRLLMQIFFRQVEVVGGEHVPADGAVIFAGNHPNSLIDPILIITTSGRFVHFAAKDTLFASRLLRFFLRGVGAVPIARRDDHGGAVDNDAAFAAMFDTLGKGGAIGIFPEGLSHDGPQLARLKTGAARLALGAAGRGARVRIVPCGLTFVRPRRFRSRVLVQYGPPIEIDDERLARNAADPAAAVRELTADVERGLRALTVNAADWDTVRALDTVRRLYQPADISIDERIELARRFNAHYPRVKDDPRVVSVMARVRDYQERLDELAVSDRDLQRELPGGRVAGKVVRHLVLLLFWLPLAAAGAPLHVPVLLLADFAGRRLTPRKDVVATTKILAGLMVAFLASAVVVAAAGLWLGLPAAVAAAVLIPASGFATLEVIERFHLLRRGLRVLGHRLRFRQEIQLLRGERGALEGEIVRLVNELRPPDLQLLFPRAQP